MNLDPFLYWIREREGIRIKRLAGLPPPWTDDPIIAKNRFCNVRREDDKITVWVRQHIRERYADHPFLWWMLCAARTFNWPDTLQYLMDIQAWPDSPDNNRELPEIITEALLLRQRQGSKVFTGVYMIRPESDRRVDWFDWPKVRYISEIVLGRLWRDRFFLNDGGLFRRGLWEAHSALVTYRGWGPFMAIQAVVDMMYCPALLGKALDRNQWMAAGPGTMRGLNRVFGRPVNKHIPQGQALHEMLELWGVFDKVVSMDLPDVANVLCEGDKFIRLLNHEGHVRTGFKAEEAYARDQGEERQPGVARRSQLPT